MTTIQLKLYPNATQRRAITNHIDASRYIYNYFLDFRISRYTNGHEQVGKYDMIKEITKIKMLEDHYWLKGINTATLQQSILRLDKAYINFFRRVKTGGAPGFPKFKSRRATEQSYTYPAYVRFSEDGNRLVLPNVGKVRCRGYRDLGGEVKQCVISLHSDGTILASVFISNENQVFIKNTNHDSVGIDVGLKKFISDSKGNFIKPFDYKDIINKIVKQHKRLSRAKKGSNNRQRTKNQLARYYRKLANKRKDNIHKVANRYLHYRNVYVEDLKILDMSKSTVGSVDSPNYDSKRKARLNNVILQASWGLLFTILDYKLKLRDSVLTKVNPRYTSITCNKCNCYSPDSRLGEKFKCVVCGHEDDADTNASKNIEHLGYNFVYHVPELVV